MPKTLFTPKEIKAYWDTTPKMPCYINSRYSLPEDTIFFPRQYDTLHPYYTESLREAEQMRVHADGFYPYRLLSERRPNEPLEVQVYREKIWVSKTKPVFSKVLNSLAKIRRSADWMIDYPDMNEFSKIAEGDTLADYCEGELPYFKTVTDWAFTALLRKYLIDANAVVAIVPLVEDIPENEFLKPYPVIYDSINILDFVQDDYAVLLNPYGATYTDNNGNVKVGKSMFIITTEAIWTFDQVNDKMDYAAKLYQHNLGYLPVFKLGGTLIAQTDNHFLFESRIAGMVPELDEAARENSDLQAVKVLHQYPERWEYTNNECKQCKGHGNFPNPHWEENCNCAETLICEACHGQGYVASGPFSKILLKPGNAIDGQTTIPAPPAGFIEKDVEIIKIQEESIKQHLADALSAINFEFLINVPLTQSGVSKQYDRNESNNTTHVIAEDIIAIMDSVYKAIGYYRYQTLYPKDEIDSMMPVIPVPENYDLYSIADAQTQLNTAKTGKTNPIILNAMEKDYSNKLFSADTETRTLLNLILSLDPFPNITEDEKMARLSNKGITQSDYVISSNIQSFVQQAIENDKTFADKDLKDQKAVMKTMAAAVIAANSTTAKIIPIDKTIADNPANAPIKDVQTAAANGGF